MDYSAVTKCYNKYKNNLLSYSDLKKVLHIYIYEFPKTQQIYTYNKDLCGEFWSFVEQKIPRYIENYQDFGTPFGGYIRYIVKFQFISFLDNFLKMGKKEKLYENKNMADTLNNNLWHSDTPAFSHQTAEQDLMEVLDNLEVKYKKANRRRIWWFVLHNSPLLSIDRMCEIAHKLQIEPQELKRVLQELQTEIREQKLKKHKLEEKCNMYFYKKSIVTQSLQNDVQLIHESVQSKKMQDIYQLRFQKNLEKLQKFPCTVSHSKLAKVLKVPKGTIDSGIALLKIKCKKLQQAKKTNKNKNFEI